MNGNFKVMCVKSDVSGKWFTKGKMYEFIDGRVIYDSGDKSVFSYSDLNHFLRINNFWEDCLELITEPKIEEPKIEEDNKMELKVGMEIRIKENLDKIKDTKGAGIMEDMFKYKGKTAKITKVGGYSGNPNMCRLDIDNGRWNWTTDMIDFPLPSQNQQIFISRNGRKTIAILKQDGKVVKRAEAICHPTDEFNFSVGSKLAMSRLVGEDKVESQIKEVKRKAKVGEYVKVVDANIVPDNEYKNGDIIKIIEVSCGNAVYANGNAKDGRVRCLSIDEYVVLENYTPNGTEKVFDDVKTNLSDISTDDLLAEIKKRMER